MQKKKHNKEPFNYSCYEFDGLSEVDRLVRIHTYPTKFKRAMDKRKEIIDLNLNNICDGYSKSNLEGVGGSKGSHSDPVANAAINKVEFMRMSVKEDNFDELMKLDESQMPKELKSYLILKRSLMLYERVIDLFSEDVAEVLKHRKQGVKNAAIAEMLGKGDTYVGDRITASYDEIEEKATECVNLFFYGRIEGGLCYEENM